MRTALATVGLALALAGCAQTDTAPQAVDSGIASVGASATATTAAPAPQPSTAAPDNVATAAASPSSRTGDEAFCDYLQESSDAAAQVDDPAAFVALVRGAQAVAPGAIADDLALYAQSVRKLSIVVTGDAEQAARADAWLTANEDAVAAAEANVDSYAQSACGRPFIAGEGQ